MPPIPTPTTLTRSVRVFVSRDWKPPAGKASHNTFGGYPSPSSLGAWYEFEVSVRGVPQMSSGYLEMLAELDRAVRSASISILQTALFATSAQSPPSPSALLHFMAAEVATQLGRQIESLDWNLSPYHRLSWRQNMPARTTVTSTFEFAASHRLNDPTKSAEENRAFFGKCNLLNGHGHNYRLAVTIAIATDCPFGIAELERLVDETVIERFDHMNLNIDCVEFRALNPSCEHIAAVCFNLLQNPLLEHSAELKSVRLWETSKTSATVEA